MTHERMRKSSTPEITIVLPVLNGESWIAESLESLRSQTFQNFEILLVDDGCTDRTIAIASAMGFTSMRMIQGPRQGLGAALALGVSLSLSPYVARQDQDDLSDPFRLEKQVAYMNAHPNCVVVGSWARRIDEQGGTLGVLKVPKKNRTIKLAMNLSSPFVHTSVLLRRDSVLKAGNYRTDCTKVFAEDYDLWARMAPLGDFYNIPKVLVSYRMNPAGITRTQGQAVGRSGYAIAVRTTEVTLGKRLSDGDRRLLSFYFGRHRRINTYEALRLFRILVQLTHKSELPFALHGLSWRVWRAPCAWMLQKPQLTAPFWKDDEIPSY